MSLFGFLSFKVSADTDSSIDFETLLGDRVQLNAKWEGRALAPKSQPILILAGHADSQGIAGAGTAGEAVDLHSATPMDPEISDELFWNLRVRDAIVRIGRARGLNISSFEPQNRNIDDGNDAGTNWSVGAVQAKKGVYVLEIHFDSYGEYGFGSGLIPPISRKLNTIDESLAKSFGRYPLFFRGGLGAPKRGIRLLEIAKLEGKLERSLREPKERKKIIDIIASQVVQSLLYGMKLL